MNWQSNIIALLVATLLVALDAHLASAQRRGNIRPSATIQLPQLSTNAVGTTVTAPDRGTVLLGGIKSLRESRSESGVPVLGKLPFVGRGFRNVGIGREVSSGMTTVTPFIHDFAAMERELLGSAPARSTASQPSAANRGANLASRRARETARRQFAQVDRLQGDQVASETHSSNSDANQTVAQLAAAEQAAAELYFSKARAAYHNGKPNIAKIYLRIAAKTATGDLRQRVLYAQNALDPNKDALAGK